MTDTPPRNLRIVITDKSNTQAASDAPEVVAEKPTRTTYRCLGDVRGWCGHDHRTLDAAERCCARDAAGIRSAYRSTYPTRAYSDRRPVVHTGATK